MAQEDLLPAHTDRGFNPAGQRLSYRGEGGDIRVRVRGDDDPRLAGRLGPRKRTRQRKRQQEGRIDDGEEDDEGPPPNLDSLVTVDSV